ncbi:MAG: hypothetical protein LAP86_26635 [Acidobacteriia bacterium]|nr:hypothetical protein [Terriglobia bacterium]
MSDIAARPRSLSLSPFIASFHYHESDLAAVMDRTLPTSQAHLIVNLRLDVVR